MYILSVVFSASLLMKLESDTRILTIDIGKIAAFLFSLAAIHRSSAFTSGGKHMY